jgi:hypothetical protein
MQRHDQAWPRRDEAQTVLNLLALVEQYRQSRIRYYKTSRNDSILRKYVRQVGGLNSAVFAAS